MTSESTPIETTRRRIGRSPSPRRRSDRSSIACVPRSRVASASSPARPILIFGTFRLIPVAPSSTTPSAMIRKRPGEFWSVGDSAKPTGASKPDACAVDRFFHEAIDAQMRPRQRANENHPPARIRRVVREVVIDDRRCRRRRCPEAATMAGRRFGPIRPCGDETQRTRRQRRAHQHQARWAGCCCCHR